MSNVSSSPSESVSGAKNKARKLWRPGKKEDLGGPLRVVVNTLIFFIVSQLVAAFIIEAGLALLHPGVDTTGMLNNSAAAQFFYILIAEALAVGLVLLALRLRRLNLGFIGLGRKPRLNDIWRAAAAFVVFYGLLIIASVLVNLFIPSINTNQQQDLGFNGLNGASDNLFALLALVILPPLGEEPLVRGYLFSGLRSRWRFWPAALLTSILFGVAHLEFGSGTSLVWAAGIDTFLLSIVLVYLRDKTGALYAGILVHMLNNLVAFGVHFH